MNLPFLLLKNDILSLYDVALYIYKQDFTSHKISRQNILSALRVQFPASFVEKSYIELRDSIYSFLQNHMDSIDNNHEVLVKGPILSTEEFEFYAYLSISKIVKIEDLSKFNIFFPTVVAHGLDLQMTSPASNLYVLNVNHDFLRNKYPHVGRQAGFVKTLSFLSDIVDAILPEYIESYILKSGSDTINLAVKFKGNLKEEEISLIFATVYDALLKDMTNLDLHFSGNYSNLMQRTLSTLLDGGDLRERLINISLEVNPPEPEKSKPA